MKWNADSKAKLLSSLLIAALAMTGCGNISETNTDTTLISGDVTTALISEAEYEPFEVNPYVYSAFLNACYPEEYREAFFNLCDALCEGRDSFEVANKEAYDFCMDPVTLNQLCPAAYKKISCGSEGFKNGIGYISYEIPVEEYLERQKSFQKEIEDVLSRYIRSDYSDLEKCLVLYDYMTSNYEFDHLDNVGQSNDGNCYACFKLKQGICSDLGTLYAYLLMQCGVNAIEVENSGLASSAGFHAWTYVSVGGKNYHIDVTAALVSETSVSDVSLDNFLVTDTDRDAAGYVYDELEIPLIHSSLAKDCKEYSFVADDESYRLPEGSFCTGYDTASNIIFYKDSDGEHEFKYE